MFERLLPNVSSLTARLSIVLSLIVIAVVCFVLLILSLKLRAERDTLVDRSLEWQAKDIAVHLERAPGSAEVLLTLPEELEKAYNRADEQYLYLISDEQGTPLFYSRHGLKLAGHLPEDGGQRISFFEFRNLELDQTFYGANLRFWIGERAFLVQVAQGPVHSDVLADTLIEEFLEQQWWAVLLFLAAIIGTVFFTVRYSLAPVEKVANVARELGPASLDARLNTSGVPSEVRPIVDAINSALTRIEQGYRREREFTANAAHQLRTPLTILRAGIEADSFERRKALDEVRSLERLVQQFLHLAQADNFLMSTGETADLRQVAEDTVAALAPAAFAKGQEVELEAPDCPVTVRGNASFIGVAIRNLVENALSYSGDGARVTVRVAAEGSVSVIDTGPGIPADIKANVFARFWRADRTVEDGAGLGLSIVSQIVEGHGGKVQLSDNPEGGAVFTLTFQLAHPAAAAIRSAS